MSDALRWPTERVTESAYAVRVRHRSKIRTGKWVWDTPFLAGRFFLSGLMQEPTDFLASGVGVALLREKCDARRLASHIRQTDHPDFRTYATVQRVDVTWEVR